MREKTQGSDGLPVPPQPDPRRRYVKGLVATVVLSALGLAVVFWASGSPEMGSVWGEVDPFYLCVALAAAALDFLILGIRNQIFIRHLNPGSPFWLPIKAELGGRFVGAITPSQAGGGPAQIFLLYRGGVAVGDSLAFLAVNVLIMIAVLTSAAAVGAWILQDLLVHTGVRVLLRYGFVFLGFVVVLLALLLLRPVLLVGPLHRVARSLTSSSSRLVNTPGRWMYGLLRFGDRFMETSRHLLTAYPWTVVASFGLTLLLYWNKFTMAWLLIRGLGAEAEYGPTLAVQALLHFVFFVAPTPGGSGIAEVSTGALMALLLPPALLGPFTFLFRTLLVYLPGAVGAWILIRALGSRGEVRPIPARETPRDPPPDPG